MNQKAAFAFGVPSNIYRFHPSTRNSTFLFHTQVFWFSKICKSWAFDFHFELQIPPTYSLRPVILNNASPTCLTAAAGTGLAGTCFWKTVIIFSSIKELYNQNSLHHSRNRARSGFRPLSKIPHCCDSKISRPCLSSSVAGHPLRPAKDQWLGRLLLFQLPNPPRAHHKADFAFYSGFYTEL